MLNIDVKVYHLTDDKLTATIFGPDRGPFMG